MEPAIWPLLAGVRFLMAIAVVNYHLFLTGIPGGLPGLDQLGSLGCILGFLVISGYSIAHSISSQPRGFYRRRAWRILPVYYVTMAASLLPYLWFNGPYKTFTGGEIIGSTVLLQTFVTDKIPIFGPAWTLAIEWWFYALAPLFVRLRPAALFALVGASIACVFIELPRITYPVHIHRWGVAAVMLLWAWLSGFVFYRVRGWTGPLVLLVGYVAAGRFPEPGTQLAYLIAAVAVVQGRQLPPQPRSLALFLNYLGDLSYPLYLVHVPLLVWITHFTKLTSAYTAVGLSMLAAAVLYHGVDAPLRRRSKVRRRRVVASEVTASALPQ